MIFFPHDTAIGGSNEPKGYGNMDCQVSIRGVQNVNDNLNLESENLTAHIALPH